MSAKVHEDAELTLPPTESDEAEIAIRDAVPEDLPFIWSGWGRSYRIGDLCQGVGNDDYFEAHRQVINILLARCTVLVACDSRFPSVLVGFTCAEALNDGTRLLHYIYVKEDFRKDENRGYISRMLTEALDAIEPAERVVCTHRTRRAKKVMAKNGWGYDPYMLWTSLPEGWLTRGKRRVPEPRPLLEARVRAGAR